MKDMTSFSAAKWREIVWNKANGRQFLWALRATESNTSSTLSVSQSQQKLKSTKPAAWLPPEWRLFFLRAPDLLPGLMTQASWYKPTAHIFSSHRVASPQLVTTHHFSETAGRSSSLASHFDLKTDLLCYQVSYSIILKDEQSSVHMTAIKAVSHGPSDGISSVVQTVGGLAVWGPHERFGFVGFFKLFFIFIFIIAYRKWNRKLTIHTNWVEKKETTKQR